MKKQLLIFIFFSVHNISSFYAQRFDSFLFVESKKQSTDRISRVMMPINKTNQNIVHNMVKSFLLHPNSNSFSLVLHLLMENIGKWLTNKEVTNFDEFFAPKQNTNRN